MGAQQSVPRAHSRPDSDLRVRTSVFVPISSFDRLNPREGEQITLLTHLHVRENAHTLYGFATLEERDIFLLLGDRVSGIGPAIAMAVLSGLPVERFKQAVGSDY